MVGRFLLALGALTASGLGSASTASQAGLNSLSNVHAIDVSPTELHVAAAYTYDGVKGSDQVFVTAAAIQPNGVAVPGLVNDITRAVVSVGSGKALSVLRMEPPLRSATSNRVEVCLQQRFSGDILCRTIRHMRSWGPAEQPPTPPPTDPRGTCTIMGQVSGPLRWTVTDHRGSVKVTRTLEVREMLMVSRDGVRSTTPLKGRHYVFSNVPAGRLYAISAGRFRSTPEVRRVDCRRNFTFRHEDFTITGAPDRD